MPTGETSPSALAVDLNGDILLAGNTTDAIYRWNGTAWSTEISTTPGSAPTAIAVSPDGIIYIADSQTDRIFRYFTGSWQLVSLFPTGESIGAGMAFDQDGDILLLGNTTDRVYRYTAGVGWTTEIDSTPPGETLLVSLAVDRQGDILIGGNATDLIYRWQKAAHLSVRHPLGARGTVAVESEATLDVHFVPDIAVTGRGTAAVTGEAELVTSIGVVGEGLADVEGVATLDVVQPTAVPFAGTGTAAVTAAATLHVVEAGDTGVRQRTRQRGGRRTGNPGCPRPGPGVVRRSGHHAPAERRRQSAPA